MSTELRFMTDDTEDFSMVPGMPSADEIRAELLRTGDVAYWRPHGTPDGKATDFAAMPKPHAQAQIGARLLAGPGANGTPFQWALWEHHNRIAQLENERDRLTERLTAVSGYDRDTGEGISAVSPEESQAIGYRLIQVRDELERINGEPGKQNLRRKLDQAVKTEQRRLKEQWMHEEAKRRAATSVDEDEIERLAKLYRKGDRIAATFHDGTPRR